MSSSMPMPAPMPNGPSANQDEGPVPAFKDAEVWLAQRGIERDPIDLSAAPEPVSDAPSVPAPEPAGEAISARDVHRLAGQAAADGRLHEDEAALPASGSGGLEDDVAEAIVFVRASTAAAPQAEGRLRAKLADRGWPPVVVDATLDRARRERLVDDPAMAAALVAERRAKGHAVARIRRDLRERGFDDAILDTALGEAQREDPEAAAFAVAREKAAALTGLTTETAFRRVVGHVARRGYPEGLARKVAREAVFTARDAERTAGH